MAERSHFKRVVLGLLLFLAAEALGVSVPHDPAFFWMWNDRLGQSFGMMAEEVGMRPGLVLGRLDAMTKRIRPAARELASEMESTGPCPVYARIVDVIENQVKSVS